jgi:CubicO group peptidase (beta-lactamase class C family)
MTFADELAEVLRSAAQEHHVPGAVAGVLAGDERTVAVFGVTGVEHPAPVVPATMTQVASITKTFTAAAVMLLVEAGSVRLEDPVSRHLPTLGPATGLDLDTITVEHLLSHQAGFDGDHLFVERITEDLEELAHARRLFPPGTGYSYNNAAFSIAGAVIEAVSGQDFATFVRERLLWPLGMVGAAFTADDAITYPVLLPHWVGGDQAYLIRGAGWQPGWELGPVDRAAGGLIASAEHLLAWCRFQRDGAGADGSVLLGRESLERLHTPVVAAHRLEDVALDWSVHDAGGAVSMGHGGVTAGYVSQLTVVPEHAFAFVGLTNATNGAAVNQAVFRWALERVTGRLDRDPEPDPTRTIARDRYTGTYLSPFAVLTVTAGAGASTLLVTSSVRDDTDGWKPPVDPPVTLAFFADDHAVTLDADGPARVVRFDGDGARAGWVLWGGRRAPRTA